MPRAVVTGGAGFLGSHLCERLLAQGWDVVCLDSLLTGRPDNITGVLGRDGFHFERYDVTNFLYVAGPVDCVCHLASPASPRNYFDHPIHTLKAGAEGTLRALGLAKVKNAAFLLASTSEVYGDPLVHPQPEHYWGNVNPVGPRAVYDEAKRYAEALTVTYRKVHGLETKIVRIFNTYGPRMQRADGRAVPAFVSQALEGRPLTVHGDGSQTRSLCFVDDLIDGLWRLLCTDLPGPVNLGNPAEVTVLGLADLIRRVANGCSEIVFTKRPVDDPNRRCPDISLARAELGWEPSVPLSVGIQSMVDWAAEHWSAEASRRSESPAG